MTEFRNQKGSLRIHLFDDRGQLDEFAADATVRSLAGGTGSGRDATMPQTLCVASGDSPRGVYAALAEWQRSGELDTSRLVVVKLDEWHRMSMDDPATCEVFVRDLVLGPLGIPAERYVGFDSDAADPAAECARIDREVDRIGGIGVAVLGIGRNGHIGLNEPGPALEARSHFVKITERTKEHAMIAGRTVDYGLTLGMRDLLASRHALVLATGSGKEAALETLFSGKITLDCPATLMLLHPNLDIICDASVVAPFEKAIERLVKIV